MLHYDIGSSFQIVLASKAKLWPKCLTDLQGEQWKGGTVLTVRVTMPGAVGAAAQIKGWSKNS